MMKTTLHVLGLFVCSILSSLSGKAQTEYFTNGTFESGNTNGWELYDQGSHEGFSISDGTFAGAPGANCFDNSNLDISIPIGGSFDIISDQSGPGIGGFRTMITLPDSIASADLSWNMRYESVAFFSSPRHELRVQLLDESMNVLETMFSASDLIFTTHYSVGNFASDITSALTPYQGQNVYIQFEQQNDFGCWPMNVDNLSLLIESVDIGSAVDIEVIPTMSEWGAMILSLSLLIIAIVTIRQKEIVIKSDSQF